MRLRRTARWLALALTLSAGSVLASGDSSTATPTIEGAEIRAGDAAPVDGLLLSLGEVRALDVLLADLDGRARVAEAREAEAAARLEAARAEAAEARARLAAAEAVAAVEAARRPTWIERHLGGCLGVGASWDGQDVAAGLTLTYGWTW